MTNRKRSRKRNANFAAIPVSAALTLSTLADATLLSQVLVGTLAEDLWAIAAHLTWAIRGQTVGEGPLFVGVADGDLTDAEIEEKIELVYVDPADRIAVERAGRAVRNAGAFPSIAIDEVIQDGKVIKTKMNFMEGNGKTIKFWVYNRSGAALTGGALIQVFGYVYGNWKR